MLNIVAHDIFDCGTVTGTGQVLPLLGESRECFEVIIQADPANAANVSLGDADTQWWVLEPGDTLQLPVRHINLVYIRFPADSTNRVNWIAMR